MPREDIIRRVKSLDDPRRCQANVHHSQCMNEAMEGTTYCQAHSATFDKHRQTRLQARTYRLGKWEDRKNALSDDSSIKSLREEIGISRIVLEEIMGACRDAQDLIIYSERIIKLTGSINTLIVSCQRLEEKTGALLDKTQVLTICDVLIGIVTDYVVDPDTLTLIGDRVEKALAAHLSPLDRVLSDAPIEKSVH